MGEARLPLTALETKGDALALALSLCWPEGCNSAHAPPHCWGEKQNPCFPSLVASTTGMCDPSCSVVPHFVPLGELGGDSRLPGSAPHFSAFLGHRGPFDAPQAFCAQGAGPGCKVQVKERRLLFLPLALSPASSPLALEKVQQGFLQLPLAGPWPSPSSCILSSQTAKCLQLPAPWSLILKWFLSVSAQQMPQSG